MAKFILKLYITGKTIRSRRAIKNLKEICNKELKDNYTLEIIDVLESPGMAEKDKVLATPTLIKNLPPPIRRIIGDLSEKERVLMGLDLDITETENEESQDD